MDNGLIFPYRRRTAHTELWMLTMTDHDCCSLRVALLCGVVGTDAVRSAY